MLADAFVDAIPTTRIVVYVSFVQKIALPRVPRANKTVSPLHFLEELACLTACPLTILPLQGAAPQLDVSIAKRQVREDSDMPRKKIGRKRSWCM